jgi:ferric-dicitrate binding protein FerR (iron transport regulator)
VTDHLAWKEHRFVFDSTSLENIGIQIEERFGVQIEIPDTSLAATRLSGYYPAENADELISMLTRLLNVKSEKMDNNMIRITN